MTRGLFAGAFWGLLTGGLVLMVAALVLDHRDAQPAALPGYLAEVEGVGPVADWDSPVAQLPGVALSSDPVLRQSTREAGRVPGIVVQAAPAVSLGVSHSLGALAGTRTPVGFIDAPTYEPFIASGAVPDTSVARYQAVHPLRPLLPGPVETTNLSAPLPERAPAPAQGILFPDAPQKASATVAASASTIALPLRTALPEASFLPDPVEIPSTPEDAVLLAPKAFGGTKASGLGQMPRVTIEPQDPGVFVVKKAPNRIAEPAPAFRSEDVRVPPRTISYPPDHLGRALRLAEVVVILRPETGLEGPVPAWASGIVWQDGAAPDVGQTDQPLLLQLDVNASAAQVATARARLDARSGPKGLLLDAAPSGAVVITPELSDLIARTPLVLGVPSAVPLDGKVQPVYRWSPADPLRVLQDLSAAQARASRDGRVIVVVPDTPDVRAIVDDWHKGLQPMSHRTAPLPFSG